MTEKQKRFVEAYMKTGNGRQAYIDAGYSSSKGSVDVNASRLLNSDKVQNYIQEISEQIKNDAIADITEMQIKLTEIIRGMSTEEVVVLVGVGGGRTEPRVIEKKPSLKEVLKACDLMLKVSGAYTQKIQVEGAVPIVISGGDELE